MLDSTPESCPNEICSSHIGFFTTSKSIKKLEQASVSLFQTSGMYQCSESKDSLLQAEATWDLSLKIQP